MKIVTNKLSLAALVIAAVGLMWSSPALAQESLDDELEQYWATEREMDVLQNRLFVREGRFGAGLFTGLLSSEPFFYYFPVGLRGTYHLSNNFGVEAGGAFMNAPGVLTHNSELTDFLENYLGEAGFNSGTHTSDRYLWRANAVAMWSPFYGKLAALQQKLVHFDLNFAAGLGVLGVERPDLARENVESTVIPEVVLGLGAHFFVTPDIVVRLDGRGFLHMGAELPTNEGEFFGRLNFPMEFNLGATYLF